MFLKNTILKHVKVNIVCDIFEMTIFDLLRSIETTVNNNTLI